MSERYFITGSQLGLLKILDKENKSRIIDEILNNQFIGSFLTDKDKKRFEKQVKKIK